ncbi:MAG: amidohydrolase family protein [Proteobacteria bacterium]|nr:amidohydrolase family protein [Pseudomonadota bacterium]
MTDLPARFHDTQAPNHKKMLIANTLIVPGFKLPVIHDGCILIEDNLIKDIGPSNQLLDKYKLSVPVIDGSGFIIMPGLFNSHTHVAMGFFRGLGHGIESMIESFLFPAEKSLTPELLEPLSYSYIFDGLKSGVTSFVDHYYFSKGVANAFEKFGVRGWIGETIADLGGAFPGRASFERARDLIDNQHFSNLIRHVIAPHATDTISMELLTEVSSFAAKNGLPIHMHLAQTRGETARVAQRDQMTPVEKAYRCGALTDQSLVVHLTDVNASDLNRIKESKATFGWCPGSTVIYENLAPIKDIFERDIPVAIGTDCAASNDSSDILQELRTGFLFAKDRNIDQAKIKPEKLLSFATTIPAKTLGMEDKMGTLEVGKFADIVCLKRSLSSEPSENIHSNLIFSMGARDVRHVMIDGRWRLWNSELVGLSHRTLQEDYITAVNEINRRVRESK